MYNKINNRYKKCTLTELYTVQEKESLVSPHPTRCGETKDSTVLVTIQVHTHKQAYTHYMRACTHTLHACMHTHIRTQVKETIRITLIVHLCNALARCSTSPFPPQHFLGVLSVHIYRHACMLRTQTYLYP